jgi:hypothetical protein
MKKPSNKTVIKKLFSNLAWPILECPTAVSYTHLTLPTN